ncbi:MAG: division/cell wall cluster transcriptional repressor MraZ [Micrococcaceae bacterium]
MFLGTYTPRLDGSGRLSLPAKFREELSKGLVLTRGQDRCLYVFSAKEFEKEFKRLKKASFADKKVRNFTRLFLSGASDETPDKQGRLNIPVALREYAGLEKELAVVGAGNHAEIWDAKRWEEYVSEQESEFSEIEGEIVPGLL